MLPVTPRENKIFVVNLDTANVDRKLLVNHPFVDNVVDGINVPTNSVHHRPLSSGHMEWVNTKKIFSFCTICIFFFVPIKFKIII